MATYSCGPAKPMRLGQVIALKEEHVAEYTRVHADGHAGVRDLLAKWHLHNFSIFMQTVAGQRLLFLYAEYTGDDYAGDMAGLSAEPRDAEWHRLCDPMQASFNGPAGGWLPMDCVRCAASARGSAGACTECASASL
jgi:L-rhamnose mutarotase